MAGTMATGHKNNKSTYKGIRFPNDLIEEIDARVERDKEENPSASFSSWVLEACGRKLKIEQRKKSKAEPSE
ncbi:MULTISPECIES: YlcI/YnfO family protein [Yersinia]